MNQQCKCVVRITIAVMVWLCPASKARAQEPIAEIIKAAVKKVIKAVDLQIQRLQNNTIRLQNAQKAVENTLSKLKLNEISGWVEKQRALYADYYDELWKVKTAILYYREIKGIMQKQWQLVEEYKRACALIRNDTHFSADEIVFMTDVYVGILEQSVRNIEQLTLVASAFKTQMDDARRLELIREADDRLDANLVDLRQFTNNNGLLSLQRAKDAQEIATVRALYGEALK